MSRQGLNFLFERCCVDRPRSSSPLAPAAALTYTEDSRWVPKGAEVTCGAIDAWARGRGEGFHDLLEAAHLVPCWRSSCAAQIPGPGPGRSRGGNPVGLRGCASRRQWSSRDFSLGDTPDKQGSFLIFSSGSLICVCWS